MSISAAIERDTVIGACAVSAGIHAALVREHLGESVAAGCGFLAAALLLAGLAVLLIRQPAGLGTIALTAVVLAGLLAAYGLATTTGVPLLRSEPEAVDGLGLATKAVEAVGLLAALHLLGSGRGAVPAHLVQTKGAHT